jgi:subtilisin family serine protease
MSTSSSSVGCLLCPNGTAPLFPDVALTFTDGSYTCSELNGIFPLVDDAVKCVALQQVASEPCCEFSWNDVCDPFNDPCPLAGDGLCKSISESFDPDGLCLLSTTDCYDCDPCAINSYTSCGTCTAQAGCYWCPTDAMCLSRPYASFPDPVFGQTLGTCTTTDDWISTCDAAAAAANSNPYSDPLYDSVRWAFDMINIQPVWEQGLTGAGVHIRINDDGLDTSHPEFAGRFDASASCEAYLPADEAAHHGTACASIAAGAGNNSECAVGMAPRATLSACNIFDEGQAYQATFEHLTLAAEAQHVSSNSYANSACVLDVSGLPPPERRALQTTECPFVSDARGSPCGSCTDFDADPLDNACTRAIIIYCANPSNYEADPGCITYLELFAKCRYNGLSPRLQAQFTRGVTEGRNGLGIVYVFATGNDRAASADTNYDGYFTSRFVISVGAVGKDGVHSMYSTTGASVFLTGPGGDFENESNWIAAKAGGGCFNIGVGTSFATPTVSGVIALVLEANPNLGWRDVQGILANTSQVLDAIADDDTWVTNAAGFRHSNKYGFGVVDAAAAVAAAASWQNFGTERMLSAQSGNVSIPIDDSTGSTITSSVTINGIMTVESVTAYVDLDSSSRGYLEIRITSPSGTKSILTAGDSPENTQLRDNVSMKLMTLKNWGESSGGEWTLSITATKPGQDVSTCIDLPLQNEQAIASDLSCYQIPLVVAQSNVTAEELCIQVTDATVACCICGGGQDVADLQDQLNSWTLVVYGRDLIGNVAPTVSPAPTTSNGHSGISPVASPSDGSGPTTLTPTIVAIRKPTAAPSVQSATSPSSANTGCVSELDDLRDCASTELSRVQLEECYTCLQDLLEPVDSTSCSPVEDVLCTAFSGACACGNCTGLYLSYFSCASGSCQFECGSDATDGGGAVPDSNDTVTNGGNTPTSASLPPFVSVTIFVTVLAVQLVVSLS